MALRHHDYSSKQLRSPFPGLLCFRGLAIGTGNAAPARAPVDARAAERYKGRKPKARAKAADAVKLVKNGKRVSEVAKALSIGSASIRPSEVDDVAREFSDNDPAGRSSRKPSKNQQGWHSDALADETLGAYRMQFGQLKRCELVEKIATLP